MTTENYYQEKLRCRRCMVQAEALLALAIRELYQAAKILNEAAEEICQSTHKERREASWKITSSIIRKQKALI